MSKAINTNYTAPANGFVTIFAVSSNTNAWLQLINVTTNVRFHIPYGLSNFGCGQTIFVKKGDIFKYEGVNIKTPEQFDFIYAEGEV